MAVNNHITPVEQKECVYMAGGEEVRLTPDFVKKYIASGDVSQITMQEIVMFMMMCKNYHLNPFLNEAYLIKFGSEKASILIGKSALEKRAFRNERYRGFKAGIIVTAKDGKPEYRTGTLVLTGETIIGGWCDVFVEGLETVSVTVAFSEYAGRKKDGSLNRQWSAKPATMIRKVAKMQALREAFPEDFGGFCTAEETGFSEPSEIPVIQPKNTVSMPEMTENQTVPEDKPEKEDDFATILEGFES